MTVVEVLGVGLVSWSGIWEAMETEIDLIKLPSKVNTQLLLSMWVTVSITGGNKSTLKNTEIFKSKCPLNVSRERFNSIISFSCPTLGYLWNIYYFLIIKCYKIECDTKQFYVSILHCYLWRSGLKLKKNSNHFISFYRCCNLVPLAAWCLIPAGGPEGTVVPCLSLAGVPW